ncbi:MAG: COR domain-containing protein [Saprospiraceae bacterium]
MPPMPNSPEWDQLQRALGGVALAVFRLDWEAWPAIRDSIAQWKPDTPPLTAEEERQSQHWYAWQYFRGEHHPHSVLLDEEGRVRGLILRETDLERIVLPDLPTLEYVCISGNKKLTQLDLPPNGMSLLRHADFSGNQLKGLELKGAYPRLRVLDVRGNKVTTFDLEEALPCLEELDLSENEFKTWNAELVDKMPTLRYLYLRKNPLDSLVTTYVKKGDGSNYLAGLKKLREAYGSNTGTEDKEYKVLVVGDGKAGKSCFVTYLTTRQFTKDWVSTHGISIVRFDDQERVSDERFGFPYILNLWDFGGQDFYHYTHRLFLQENTAYILLWHKDTEEKDFITQTTDKGKTYQWPNKKLRYWLAYIRHLAPNSPVVVAQTESPPDNPRTRHGEEFTLREKYEGQFPYLSEFLNIDAGQRQQADTGYKDLLNALEKAIKKLGKKQPLTPGAQATRAWLDGLKKKDATNTSTVANNTLDYDFFITEAKRLGELDPQKLLVNWLVPTGVVFYKPGLFDNKIILNQDWMLKAAYRLFEREGAYDEIKEQAGHFDGVLLNRFWQEYRPEERDWFLRFMLQSHLCFDITTKQEKDVPWEQRRYISVELLPEKRPQAFEEREKRFQESGESICTLTYAYKMLHFGIMQQFIAITHRYAEVKNIYKAGMLIDKAGASAIVEAEADRADFGGAIHIRVLQRDIWLLREIQKELDELQRLDEVEQWISVGDAPPILLQDLLKDVHCTHLVTKGRQPVDATPYRIFLPEQEEKVRKLTEEETENGEVPAPEKDEPTPVFPPPAPAPVVAGEKARIRQLLSNGKLKKALDALDAWKPNNNDVALLKSRYETMSQHEREGTWTNDEIKTEKQRITKSALELLEEDKPKFIPFMEKYGKQAIFAAMVLGIIFVVGLFVTGRGGEVKMPGVSGKIYPEKTEVSEEIPPSATTVTLVGSVVVNGRVADATTVTNVFVQDDNMVNPAPLASGRFKLKNVKLPTDKIIQIGIACTDGSIQAAQINASGLAIQQGSVVDCGTLPFSYTPTTGTTNPSQIQRPVIKVNPTIIIKNQANSGTGDQNME